MKKKILLIIGVILISILGYKIFLLNYYSFKDIDKYTNVYTLSDTLTVKTKINTPLSYISYDDMLIPNIFTSYTQEKTPNSLELTKDNSKVTIMISNSPYYDLTHLENQSFDNKNIKGSEVKYYLNKNKINNELEVFAYIASTKYQKDANILSSSKYIKGRYGLLKYVYSIIPHLDTCHLEVINGDLDGYISISSNNGTYYKVINIIKNDKLYTFTLTSNTEDTFSNDMIETLLDNLIIK